MSDARTRQRKPQHKKKVRDRVAFASIDGQRDYRCAQCGKRLATIWPAGSLIWTDALAGSYDAVFYAKRWSVQESLPPDEKDQSASTAIRSGPARLGDVRRTMYGHPSQPHYGKSVEMLDITCPRCGAHYHHDNVMRDLYPRLVEGPPSSRSAAAAVRSGRAPRSRT